MSILIDSYNESNQDGDYARYQDSATFAGQSFEGDGRVLDNVQLYLKKSGTVNGTIRVFIYAHTGTYGSTGDPTGAVLATSASINSTDLGTSYGLETFTFSGVNKITLANGTHYFIVLDYVDFTESGWIGWGYDDSSPTHGGNYSIYYSGSWHSVATRDLCFYVYGDELPSASPSLSPSASLSPSLSSSPSASLSPSPSLSPSASESISVSASISPSASLSPSSSVSASTSPSPPLEFVGVKVAKTDINVLEATDPSDFKFNSEYGTLKYFETGTLNFTIDGDLDGNLETVGQAAHTHNLGYCPYVEVYMLNPDGVWEYCPTYSGGASTTWQSYVVITPVQLKVYAVISGFSQGGVDFTFKYFIYKNNLNL